MHRFLPVSLLFAAASADIGLSTFSNAGCTLGGPGEGDFSGNLSSFGVGSDCIATTGVQSSVIRFADPGFQCQFFSDNNCAANGGQLVNTLPVPLSVGVCISPMNVQSYRCGQNLPVPAVPSPTVAAPPAAETTSLTGITAEVSIGKTLITADAGGVGLVRTGVDTSCGETACDPTTQAKPGFSHFNKQCQQIITMSGRYDNSTVRDYMAALLAGAAGRTDTNFRIDTTGSAEDNDRVLDTVTFATVTLLNAGEGSPGTMTYELGVECQVQSDGDCHSLVGTVTGDLLKAIPAVGGLVAAAFNIIVQGCPLSS